MKQKDSNLERGRVYVCVVNCPLVLGGTLWHFLIFLNSGKSGPHSPHSPKAWDLVQVGCWIHLPLQVLSEPWGPDLDTGIAFAFAPKPVAWHWTFCSTQHFNPSLHTNSLPVCFTAVIYKSWGERKPLCPFPVQIGRVVLLMGAGEAETIYSKR